MYEACPEAHRHWLASIEAEAKIDPMGAGNPFFDIHRKTANVEYTSAATSWKAHGTGVCSCRYKAIVEWQRALRK
jgi:hypothetical protein